MASGSTTGNVRMSVPLKEKTSSDINRRRIQHILGGSSNPSFLRGIPCQQHLTTSKQLEEYILFKPEGSFWIEEDIVISNNEFSTTHSNHKEDSPAITDSLVSQNMSKWSWTPITLLDLHNVPERSLISFMYEFEDTPDPVRLFMRVTKNSLAYLRGKLITKDCLNSAKLEFPKTRMRKVYVLRETTTFAPSF